MANQNCTSCPECCAELCPNPKIDCVTCDAGTGTGGCGCCTIEVVLLPSTTYLAGMILGERSSDGRFGVFDSAATDGRQTPRGILKFKVTTDENGAVHGNEYNPYGIDCPRLTTPMYICGVFRTEEIIGDLAAATSTGLFGRVVQGPYDGPGLFKL